MEESRDQQFYEQEGIAGSGAGANPLVCRGDDLTQGGFIDQAFELAQSFVLGGLAKLESNRSGVEMQVRKAIGSLHRTVHSTLIQHIHNES